ncbi:unannotated protein [freshwater metagenome]|uniref:beta-N-acetylhexosaminidase n=1 Tax=freshwater metagenome TaxID=449393 RepID=A0A6J7F6N3_9ZZZZ|nr:family 20 glycosylhydrolase [Actinomycetota bacterium]
MRRHRGANGERLTMMTATDRLEALLPLPRRMTRTGGEFTIDSVDVCQVGDLPAEGYRLTIDGSGVRIDAADDLGEHYARMTLGQLGSPAAGVVIEDWPDLAVRGVMLDVSRDRVPTVAALKGLIRQLAGWKVNQLQLYFEHTFAYVDHRDVWDSASPFTADEIVDIDRYCAAHHIELVANQNCLGHAERWLRLPRYRSLALRPDGFDIMGLHRGPTTLDPSNPAAFEFVSSLLDELVPLFSANRVHIGMDEPWELPAERIGDYVDWVRRLCALPALRDREVLVWGDVLAHHPQVLGQLPDNVTVTEWGYEADHPFDERISALTEQGRSRWVCPGTSSWQSLLGRTTNMRANTTAAARAARDGGATGMLMTDWGDWGHHQPGAVSMVGYAYGAAMSWCAGSNADIDLSLTCDPAAIALGNVYLATASQRPNCSAFVRHLYLPQARVRHLTFDELDSARGQIHDGLSLLAPRIDVDANELRWAAEAVALALDDAEGRLHGDGTMASISVGQRTLLAERADGLGQRHAELWLRRSRPGGLAGSRRWFTRLRQGYLDGAVPANWPYPEVDLSDGEPT